MEKTQNTVSNDEEIEIDLLELAKALWHRAWVIVLATLAAGIAALAIAFFLVTPLYKSSAMMYVNNSSISVGSTQVDLSDLTAAQSLVDTYVVILKTRGTLEQVIEQTGVPYDYEELYDMIEAAPVNSTEVFEITVTSPDPEEAELIANTIAQLLPVRISDIVEGSSVKIVDYAIVPSKKDSPSLTQWTVVGLVLGFLVSCGVISLLKIFDQQIRSEDYVRDTFGLPLLAAVPDLSAKDRSGYYAYKQPGKSGKGASL